MGSQWIHDQNEEDKQQQQRAFLFRERLPAKPETFALKQEQQQEWKEVPARSQ